MLDISNHKHHKTGTLIKLACYLGNLLLYNNVIMSHSTLCNYIHTCFVKGAKSFT